MRLLSSDPYDVQTQFEESETLKNFAPFTEAKLIIGPNKGNNLFYRLYEVLCHLISSTLLAKHLK